MWRSSSTTRMDFTARTIRRVVGGLRAECKPNVKRPNAKGPASLHDNAFMFGTVVGGLPRPPLPADAAPEALLDAVLSAQEEAGLEPVSDGGLGVGATPVERWQSTAARTDRMVKAAILGPYSRGGAGGGAGAREARDEARAEIEALVAAGCPYIEVQEPAAVDVRGAAARQAFAEAHGGLLEGLSGVHLSLVITGGNADRAGVDVLLTAPFASLTVDLIAGPDNWLLVAGVPGDRGIVCGAVSAGPASDQKEVLLWAAEYAASTRGRGLARVGLATASSLAGVSWEAATRKLAVLGEAVRLSELPVLERAARLDPRAVDIRSAALGRYAPGRRRRPPAPNRD